MKLRLPLLIALLLPLLTTAGERLSEKRLQQIIAMPHEDKIEEPELLIYPKARAYDITISTTHDGQTIVAKATATEKRVAGKFIVSEGQAEDQEEKFAMVVEFDAQSQRYRKYLLLEGKLSGYREGLRCPGTRSIAWIDLTRHVVRSQTDQLSTETHSDTGSTWSSVLYDKGVVQVTETGIAKVTK